ncbi:MAG: glycosyltransferase family 9 protein, partial [Candidatus Binataceae bacterium]
NVLDLVGQTSLLDLLAIYGVSDGVITHDSGPLHLAILARAPTVALFGPTLPNHFVPKGMPVTVLWGGDDLACRPCFDGKAYAPCRDNRCIKQISVAQVVAALEKLVNFEGNREASAKRLT